MFTLIANFIILGLESSDKIIIVYFNGLEIEFIILSSNMKLFNHTHSILKIKSKLNFYSGSSSQMYFSLKNKLK